MNIRLKLLLSAIPGAALAVGAYISVRPDLQPRIVPQIDPALKMPAKVAAFVTKSCGDCHSNGTRWPWYAKIPPASWMIEHDVQHAQKAMNLGDWSRYSRGRASGLLGVACADLQSGRMPLRQYLWMHPAAKPKPEEVQMFCDWSHNARSLASVP